MRPYVEFNGKYWLCSTWHAYLRIHRMFTSNIYIYIYWSHALNKMGVNKPEIAVIVKNGLEKTALDSNIRKELEAHGSKIGLHG